ncbi:aspergillopepsin-2 precursor [Trichoderma arundinaceum]|uniref:Aspergillopepsin-2 n=1 Tax=Trichoderma arundinaceum TaxID=490622 RepID=A0A395NN26_TRIAR|nr:aspergillopepsin-2 precursor [Trichoderma arundinaceum]
MKFSLITLSHALLVGYVCAAPSRTHSTLSERIARRAAARASRPNERLESLDSANANDTHVSYSTNWSGAVLTSPPAGETFDGVSASFVVPTPKVPSGSSSRGSYSASAWVGIDGDTYQNSILQTGVDFTISNGKVSYDAWYEWYPDFAYDFSISISAGDTVRASVSSTSSTAGVAVIENLTTGKTVSKSLTSSAALGGQNAEWIVEDYEEGSSLVNLANWGSVVFTDATASTGSSSLDATGASILDIKQNNKVLTSVTVSGSTVTDNFV